jgi:hypothetical protein
MAQSNPSLSAKLPSKFIQERELQSIGLAHHMILFVPGTGCLGVT